MKIKLLILFWLAILQTNVFAKCKSVSLKNLISESEEVVLGKILTASHDGNYFEYSIEIDESYRGNASSSIGHQIKIRSLMKFGLYDEVLFINNKFQLPEVKYDKTICNFQNLFKVVNLNNNEKEDKYIELTDPYILTEQMVSGIKKIKIQINGETLSETSYRLTKLSDIENSIVEKH